MITNALEIVSKSITQTSEPRAFALMDGDSGVVIRKNGTIELFQQGIRSAALSGAYSALSDEDKQTLLNGQSLMALSIVASSPELQQTILSFAVNEGVATVPTANNNG